MAVKHTDCASFVVAGESSGLVDDTAFGATAVVVVSGGTYNWYSDRE